MATAAVFDDGSAAGGTAAVSGLRGFLRHTLEGLHNEYGVLQAFRDLGVATVSLREKLAAARVESSPVRGFLENLERDLDRCDVDCWNRSIEEREQYLTRAITLFKDALRDTTTKQ
jgi:hypothetical protein